MARFVEQAIVALLVLSFVAVALGAEIGGASTSKSLVGDIITSFNTKNPSLAVAAYDSVGSGKGIDGFKAGTYLIAVSDEPMQQPSFTKITAPFVVATYSFFVHSSGMIKMTGLESYKIYSGAIKAWSGIPGAAGKLSGAIATYYRSDKSGTTAVIQNYWKAAAKYKGPTDGTSFTFSGLTTGVAGTGDMCTGVKDTVGAIGYAHAGACLPVVKANPAAIAEVALKNAAGKYVASSAYAAKGILKYAINLPGKVPKPTGNWYGLTFVNKAGKKTPAMVSMQYSFVKQSISAASGGAKAKAFIKYLIATAPSRASAFGFYKVPGKWVNPSTAATGKITVS